MTEVNCDSLVSPRLLKTLRERKQSKSFSKLDSVFAQPLKAEKLEVASRRYSAINNTAFLGAARTQSQAEFDLLRRRSAAFDHFFVKRSDSRVAPENPIRRTPIDRPFKNTPSTTHRCIVLDGSNVAMQHGNRRFSWRGLELAVDQLRKKGHTEVFIVLPKSREGATHQSVNDFRIMRRLCDAGCLVWAPARRNIDGRCLSPYDDRFVIRTALLKEAAIVSNDQYRDLMRENADWKKYICDNLLMFTWVDDTLMLPEDPLGRDGPSLDQFLRKTASAPSLWSKMRKV